MARQQQVRKIREEMDEAAEGKTVETPQHSPSHQQHQHDHRGPEWHELERIKAAQQMQPGDL